MANQNLRRNKIFPESNEVVWVNKRYIPIELRSTAPVSRYKFINSTNLARVPEAWRKPVSPPIQFYSRQDEESTFHPFSPSTRCEEWSTLRQILPSRGRPLKQLPPRWGCNQSNAKGFTSKNETRFPIINSPMTQYADDMHLTNRLFKLH